MEAELFLPLQGLDQSMRISLDLEYLNCLIGGACCESPPIVIQTGIVLEVDRSQ